MTRVTRYIGLTLNLTSNLSPDEKWRMLRRFAYSCYVSDLARGRTRARPFRAEQFMQQHKLVKISLRAGHRGERGEREHNSITQPATARLFRSRQLRGI